MVGKFKTNVLKIKTLLFYSKTINFSGSNGTPLYQSSKCKCGPVDREPLFPTIAMGSPAETLSPVVFNITELCL